MLNFHKFIATFFYTGYTPIAPGTAGAALAAIFLILWSYLAPEMGAFGIPLLITTIIVTIIGAYSTDQLAAEWGKDPSRVVVDEAIGMWISVLFLPVNIYIIFAGFVLFRLFDIWKPLGIRKMESIPGGWGVMMDDVLAGIYAWITLRGLIYLYDYMVV
jgi:phosphatidylglycerophosphatase A